MKPFAVMPDSQIVFKPFALVAFIWAQTKVTAGRAARSELDLHELHAAGCPTPDGDGRLGAAEVLCYQADEFPIGFAIHGWRLELGKPQTFG